MKMMCHSERRERFRPEIRILLSTILLTFGTAVFAAAPDVKVQPLHFQPAQADRVTLQNGVAVYVKEDHELPLFDLMVRMKASPADEKVPDSFTFLSEVWRTGGTKTRSPERLNDELEQMAASVETSADEETISIQLQCSSKDIAKGLEILTDVMLHPAFRDDQFTLFKAKTLESLRRKNETPSLIARRLFRDVVYGKNHYYAHQPTEKSVERVKPSDLRALHARVAVPDGAIVAAAGDFKKEELIALLEKTWAGWRQTGRVLPPYDLSVRASTSSTHVYFVEKASNQTRITIGRTCPPRHHPDHFAIELADYILGGGGPSRLFGEIRSRRGLAYVVGSFFLERKGPGMLGVGCQTKTPSTIAAVKAIDQELDKFAKGPVGDGEVRLAKDANVNSMVFNWDSAWEVANSRASDEFYGYPDDYAETYSARVQAVTREDIQNVARKYYGKDAMRVIIVGQEKGFDAPLEQLGTVTRVPLASSD